MQAVLVDRWSCDTWPHSADEVEREARQQLDREPHLYNHSVRCRYQQGVLTLHGHVPCYFLKQIAQHSVAGVSGVKRVINRLVVDDAESSGS
ncbi:MAG: BON domain-containing protein [Planctomycetaceae bacterium]|nr:BON domain-containing protein [Planctomycetaceae bacterium]